MDTTLEGFEAFRAWRQVPRDVKRAYAKGTGADPEHARAALGYSRFATSGLGLLVYIGPAVLILVAFSVVMSLMDIGPDGVDLAIFGALIVFVTYNHIRAAGRIGRSARRSLDG